MLKAKGDPKDKLLFKWVRGAAVTQSELADPTNVTSYRMCVYTGNTNDLLEAFSIPASPANWSPLSDKGYKYEEANSANGLTKILLKGSQTAGKSKVLAKGKGVNLPHPYLGIMPVPVTVHVVNLDTGVCIEGVFDSADVKKNEDWLFKAKAQQ